MFPRYIAHMLKSRIVYGVAEINVVMLLVLYEAI